MELDSQHPELDSTYVGLDSHVVFIDSGCSLLDRQHRTFDCGPGEFDPASVFPDSRFSFDCTCNCLRCIPPAPFRIAIAVPRPPCHIINAITRWPAWKKIAPRIIPAMESASNVRTAGRILRQSTAPTASINPPASP